MIAIAARKVFRYFLAPGIGHLQSLTRLLTDCLQMFMYSKGGKI
jgi:hypothetical protein